MSQKIEFKPKGKAWPLDKAECSRPSKPNSRHLRPMVVPMEVGFWLCFVLLFVIAAVAASASAKAAEARRLALVALSGELGFDFHPNGLNPPTAKGFFAQLAQAVGPKPNQQFIERFTGFSPFGQGHSQDVKNLMVGRDHRGDWYLFDFSYKVTTSNGKTTTTTTYEVGVVALRANLIFPALSLSPENVLHRIGTKLGLSEMTFELEEFNRRYFIKCDDPRAAHDYLHPMAIQYLMELPIRTWQMAGMYVVLTRNRRFSPEEVRQVYQEVAGFMDLVPDYVREDRGFKSNWSSPLD